MKATAYIGADPGLSGALALYIPSVPFSNEVVLEVSDMPTLAIDGKRQIDMWALAALLDRWAHDWSARAVVERVHSMPKQGVASSFNFGFSAGALQQALASANVPMTLISPATWKAVYGLRGGPENKDMSRQKASQLFPAHVGNWSLKKHDGRAEAVLLAHYGSKLR